MPRFCVVVLIFVLLLLAGAQAQTLAPLRLSEQQLESGLTLEGRWDFQGPRGLHTQIEVPGAWERVYRRRLPVFGTATYRRTVRVPEALRGKSLQFYMEMFAGSSLRIYANDVLVGYNGAYVGSESRVPHFIPFEVTQQDIEIKVVVSNFKLQWGGLVRPLWLGRSAVITQLAYRRSINFNVIFGIFVFLCFFHLVLFVFYRHDKATFWFCLICLSASVYMEFFALHNLEHLVGDIPLEWSIKGVRLGLYSIIPCVLWYGHALAPEYFSRRMLRGVSLLCGLLALTVVLPARWHTSLINVWFLMAMGAFLYNFYLVIRLSTHRKLHFYVYSSLLFSLVTLNDIFNALGWIETGYYARFGVLAFCLTQSGFLAWRLQNNYRQALQFQQELSAVNQGLESLVEARTQEVNQKNEQLNQLLNFKEEMVEMLVHDIKTPLNVLLELPEDSSHQQASQRVKNLLEQIVRLNKNEQADLPLQLDRHNLNTLVNRVFQVLQSWALNQKIQLTNLLPTDVWLEVDGLLLERVLQNILDNALKHSPRGSEVRVTGHASGAQFILEIIDDGPGIPEAVRQHALEKYQSFAQGDVPRSSGLGLYFCQQVVLAHGGDIQLLSGPQGGARVRLTLPLSPVLSAQHFAFESQQLQALQPYVKRLQALKSYHISELKPILQDLTQFEDPQIQAWLAALKVSIEDVNETDYRKLIDQVSPPAHR